MYIKLHIKDPPVERKQIKGMGNIILYKGMARVGLFCSVGVVPLECLGNVTGVRE